MSHQHQSNCFRHSRDLDLRQDSKQLPSRSISQHKTRYFHRYSHCRAGRTNKELNFILTSLHQRVNRKPSHRSLYPHGSRFLLFHFAPQSKLTIASAIQQHARHFCIRHSSQESLSASVVTVSSNACHTTLVRLLPKTVVGITAITASSTNRFSSSRQSRRSLHTLLALDMSLSYLQPTLLLVMAPRQNDIKQSPRSVTARIAKP